MAGILALAGVNQAVCYASAYQASQLSEQGGTQVILFPGDSVCGLEYPAYVNYSYDAPIETGENASWTNVSAEGLTNQAYSVTLNMDEAAPENAYYDIASVGYILTVTDGKCSSMYDPASDTVHHLAPGDPSDPTALRTDKAWYPAGEAVALEALPSPDGVQVFQGFEAEGANVEIQHDESSGTSFIIMPNQEVRLKAVYVDPLPQAETEVAGEVTGQAQAPEGDTAEVPAWDQPQQDVADPYAAAVPEGQAAVELPQDQVWSQETQDVPVQGGETVSAQPEGDALQISQEAVEQPVQVVVEDQGSVQMLTPEGEPTEEFKATDPFNQIEQIEQSGPDPNAPEGSIFDTVGEDAFAITSTDTWSDQPDVQPDEAPAAEGAAEVSADPVSAAGTIGEALAAQETEPTAGTIGEALAVQETGSAAGDAAEGLSSESEEATELLTEMITEQPQEAQPAQTEAQEQEAQPAQTEVQEQEVQPVQTEAQPQEAQPAQTEAQEQEAQPAQAEVQSQEVQPAQTEAQEQEAQPAQTEAQAQEPAAESTPAEPGPAETEHATEKPQEHGEEDPTTPGEGQGSGTENPTTPGEGQGSGTDDPTTPGEGQGSGAENPTTPGEGQGSGEQSAEQAPVTADEPQQTAVYKVSFTNPADITVAGADGTAYSAAEGAAVPAGTVLNLTAGTADPSRRFSSWTVSGEGAVLSAPNAASTQLTTGAADAAVTANYVPVSQVTVTSGSGSGAYAQGENVQIAADKASTGWRFDHWEVTGGSASLNNAYAAKTSFAMPGAAISVRAVYVMIEYALTVNGGKGGGAYTMDEEVSLEANWPAAGKEFDKWVIVSGHPDISGTDRFYATLTMPASDVTVRATYKDGPNPAYNAIEGLENGAEYLKGSTLSFHAAGNGMGNTNPNPGDYRYKPTGYQIGSVSGSWQDTNYTTSMAINAVGDYTLTVTFTREVYRDGTWTSDGTIDTKSVSFHVVNALSVQTGDSTPVVPLVGAAVAALAIIIVILVLRRRRSGNAD